MAKAAHSEELKAAFQKHETETEDHVERIVKQLAQILLLLRNTARACTRDRESRQLCRYGA
jgi:ferritin-like metal-binding protein YciE